MNVSKDEGWRFRGISYQMLIGKQLKCIFVFLGLLLTSSSGGFVGVNIGKDVSKIPSPLEVVAILRKTGIYHVRLYNADSSMLRALADTGIEVIVGVSNEEILGLGESPSIAATWVSKNIISNFPSTNITAIAVGNEVLTSVPNAAPVLVSAMNYLHKALVASNLNSKIKVSTPLPFEIIPLPFPPSTATFNSSWNSTIYQLLQFLKNTNSYFMINAYPYYGYTSGNGIFPLNYALFEPLSSAFQIVDPNTLFHYQDMLDAMVDAVYFSMESLGISGIPVVVTETGWPSHGGVAEPAATAQNAATFVNNLILRVLRSSGPPSQPSMPINAYIYELLNEDDNPGPDSEKNWGMFFSNGSAVYPLGLNSSKGEGNSSGIFCIARSDSHHSALQAGIDWACGQGGANCFPIQSGQPCYLPNTLLDHASYAFNDYYQKQRDAGGTCDFGGAATTTNVDPSHGSCVFLGSPSASRNTTSYAQPPGGSPRGTPGSADLGVHGMKLLMVFALLLPLV